MPVRPALPGVITDLERLQWLRATALLDSPCEEAFDRLTRLAAKVLRAPISLVSLVDEERQFFKSCVGLPQPLATLRETPLTHSFCKYLVLSGRPLVLNDARVDPVFQGHPAVRELGAVAYAGIPLVTTGGVRLGSFCVIDVVPRQWSVEDIEVLSTLAASAMAEVELRATLIELQSRTREVSVEREQNAAKDEFLAFLSHELRTPVATVLLWAKLLNSGALPDERQRDAVGNIIQAAEEQSRLVGELLDTAAILNGRLGIDEAPTDLTALTGSVVESMRPMAEGKGLKLRLRLPEAAVVVSADAYRIRQVISNLLSNAIKFTPPHGSIDVTLQAEGGLSRIEVADDGEGILPAFLPHIFERFRQANLSLSREHVGLGLGLAIVRHIVELHRGTVTARSPGLDLGATFTIELPLLPQPAVS